jgi:hypothetical protein
MKDVSEIRPPSAPADDEARIELDPAFEADCMLALAENASQNKWQFKNSLFTRSEKWGLIWRVDFVTPVGSKAGRTNRATCWRLPDQARDNIGILIDFEQKVRPLKK